MKNKKKIMLLFPHLPNPRMIKRVNALKEQFIVEVIYWDRGVEFNKTNKIPQGITNYCIYRTSNEGIPLKRIRTTIGVIKEALKIIRKSKPKILYISKTDMLVVGVLYKYFYDKEVELIYEVSDLHSLMIDKQNELTKKVVSILLNKIERFLCKNIKTLVVTSEYFYKDYYNFVKQEKVLFVPNTPNKNVFDKYVRKLNQKYTIGFIGAIRYGNQIKLLIDAAEICNVNVFIAGKGVDYKKIKDYSKGKNHVEIYGEYEYEKEIKYLYEKVDCIYSVYDANLRNVQVALPNRLYEGVYTKTPILAAKNTYLGEIVEKFEIGKAVNCEEIGDLIKAINELQNNKELVKQMKQNALELSERWVLDVYNDQLVKAFIT